jgi:hypothetical protein
MAAGSFRDLSVMGIRPVTIGKHQDGSIAVFSRECVSNPNSKAYKGRGDDISDALHRTAKGSLQCEACFTEERRNFWYPDYSAIYMFLYDFMLFPFKIVTLLYHMLLIVVLESD